MQYGMEETTKRLVGAVGKWANKAVVMNVGNTEGQSCNGMT